MQTQMARSWREALRDHAGWAISLFLVILGGKLWLIHHAATSLPLLDQWDGEGGGVFLPYLQGHLSLADLLRGHNEHRILFTRLLDLALLQLNHQWDNQLEVVVNAVIHAATLTGFGCVMARLLGKICWPVIWLPLTLVSVPPFAWENTIWGFQSSFYFLLLFSLLTIVLLILSKPLTFRWWLGVAAGVATLFTMASGFLAAAAVIAVIVLEQLKLRSGWRGRSLTTLTVCALVLLAGLLLAPTVPQHKVLHAHSLGDFLRALTITLAWPLTGWPAFALLNLVPLVLLGWLYLRSRGNDFAAEKVVFGVAIWVVLQALAAAYARGADGKPPPSRYMDLSSFMMVAGCLASAIVLTRYQARLLFRVGLGLWFAACLWGLWSLADHAVRVDIPKQQVDQERLLEATREFLATGSPAPLQAPDLQIPPLAKLLVMLRSPEIRGILPECVQPEMSGTNNPTNVAAAKVLPAPRFSLWADHLAAAWKSLLTLGLGCLFVTIFFQAIPQRSP